MTDPRTRLGLLACLGLLAVTLDRPASLGALAVLCGLPLLATRAGRRWWRHGLLAVCAAVWGTALSQGLFYADHPRVALVAAGPLVLYREGLVHGLVQSLRLVAVTLAGLAVALGTPADRLFAAMLRLRVPFGLAFLAVTALRFVPETAREVRVVRRARARRGRPVHQRPPWAWLALEVDLLRPVVARALRRSRAMAESLDARGFDPVAPRAVRRPLCMGPWDVALLLCAAAVTLSALAARLAWLLYVGGVAYVPRLRPLYGFVRQWL